MKKAYRKVEPIISEVDFINKALSVNEYTSSGGKHYKVMGFVDNEMLFQRLDADLSRVWTMNLNNVYEAYLRLNDFKTINFKPFVPITHSPARGLLLHLNMIEESDIQ